MTKNSYWLFYELNLLLIILSTINGSVSACSASSEILALSFCNRASNFMSSCSYIWKSLAIAMTISIQLTHTYIKRKYWMITTIPLSSNSGIVICIQWENFQSLIVAPICSVQHMFVNYSVLQIKDLRPQVSNYEIEASTVVWYHVINTHSLELV